MELYNKFIKKLKLEEEAVLKEIQNNSIEKSKFDLYVENSMKLLANLSNMWELSSCIVKQKLQNLLFPNGIRYNRQKDSYLSLEVNPVLSIINTLSVSYSKNSINTKTKKMKKFSKIFQF